MKEDKSEQRHNLLTSIEHIWTYSLSILKDICELIILEVKLAGRSLIVVLFLILIIILLLLSSWFSLLIAFVFWLTSFHMNLILALIIASSINFLIALILGLVILKQVRNLQFQETKKQLGLMEGENYESTSKD